MKLCAIMSRELFLKRGINLHCKHRMEQTLLLLQLSDSAFPTGGFSHSLGLESCVQHKQIKNSEDLKSFIICLLENAGSFCIPYVQEAHVCCSEISELKELDHLYHICTANHIANRASVRQGKAMADTASRVFQIDDLRHITSSLKHFHHAVVFGAVYGSLGLSLEATLSAFMSGIARTAVASAVRLDKVGPLEAQKILAELQKLIPDVISRTAMIRSSASSSTPNSQCGSGVSNLSTATEDCSAKNLSSETEDS